MRNIEVADIDPVVHGGLMLMQALVGHGPGHLQDCLRELQPLPQEDQGGVLGGSYALKQVQGLLLHDLEGQVLPQPSLRDRKELRDQEGLLPIIGPEKLIRVLGHMALHSLRLDEKVGELDSPIPQLVLVDVVLQLAQGEGDQEGHPEILQRDGLACRVDVRFGECPELLLQLIADTLNRRSPVIPQILVEIVPVELNEKP